MILDQHEVRVFSGTTELEALENAGTITADRGWSPHVQGTLNVRVPASNVSTQPGAMLTIELTQRFGYFAFTRDLTDLYAGLTTAALTAAFAGGTTATFTALIAAGSWNTPVRASTGRTLELVIISRRRSRDEHSVTLASVEALIQDWLSYKVDGDDSSVAVTVEGDTTASLLRGMIALHAAQTATEMPTILNLATDRIIAPISYVIEAGDPTIAAVFPVLTQTLQRLFSPGDSSIILTDRNQVSAGAITVASGVGLIEWEVSEERTAQQLVKFTGTLTNPAARPIYSSTAFPDINPPHEKISVAPNAYVPHPGLMSTITSALGPYLRAIGLDDSPVRLVTVNDYSVMPGSPITYTLPDEAPVKNSIDALTWQLGGQSEMNIWV